MEVVGLDWIWLTTTHVLQDILTILNVSHGCFHSLNKLLKPDYIVQVWGLVEVSKLHQTRGDSSAELHRIFDRSYQIEEPRFS